MQNDQPRTKKVVSPEVFIFLLLLTGFFWLFAARMGVVSMLGTMMQTAFLLLKDTVLYITAIAVIAGGLSGLLQEFGVIALIDKCLSPLMQPLFGLPGAASIGALSTYLSDNPSILALAADPGYRRFFKKYQLPALTNLGTGFGMGAIITTFVLGLSALNGKAYGMPALIGNIGAVIGSLVSTRLMLRFTGRVFGRTARRRRARRRPPCPAAAAWCARGASAPAFLPPCWKGASQAFKSAWTSFRACSPSAPS